MKLKFLKQNKESEFTKTQNDAVNVSNNDKNAVFCYIIVHCIYIKYFESYFVLSIKYIWFLNMFSHVTHSHVSKSRKISV